VNLTYGRALGEVGVIRMVVILAGSGTQGIIIQGARDEHAMKLGALMIFVDYSSSTVLSALLISPIPKQLTAAYVLRGMQGKKSVGFNKIDHLTTICSYQLCIRSPEHVPFFK
jgi:hypothetical protein